MRNPARLGAIVAAAAVVLVSASRVIPVLAQQTASTLDRTKVPPSGPPPVLRVPTATKGTLANGADFLVSEKHDLPLVSFSITFMGGADQFETAARRGVAAMAAAMMSEGTKTRDGEALSNALQLLGTNVQIQVGAESGSIAFQSTTANFPKVLGVLADMLENSTFPAPALERLRAQRLVAFNQAKVQPSSISSRVYAKLLYGSAHPFGQQTTEESLKAMTREDVVTFHDTYFQPGRALVSVVGDVNPATVKATVERALAGWTKAGTKPAFSFPALPAPHPTTIYLVDKPGAAQSTFAIGLPGPPRSTSDFFALQVMNTILGGMFQSRLNANIREQKGYSYGVSSSFGFGKGPGPFKAGGDIVSAKTDLALVEFMKELRGIVGARPITPEELSTAKDSLIQRLPGTFGSVAGTNTAFTTIWSQGLPDNYYQQFGANIAAVTAADVLRVAKQYIDVDHLAIVIVGDRASIEAPLKATGLAPVVVLDGDGAPVSH